MSFVGRGKEFTNVCLSVLEVLNQMIRMRIGVERDELDERVISQDKTHDLGGLRFV
jgi:hypothetical protein